MNPSMSHRTTPHATNAEPASPMARASLDGAGGTTRTTMNRRLLWRIVAVIAMAATLMAGLRSDAIAHADDVPADGGGISSTQVSGPSPGNPGTDPNGATPPEADGNTEDTGDDKGQSPESVPPEAQTNDDTDTTHDDAGDAADGSETAGHADDGQPSGTASYEETSGATAERGDNHPGDGESTGYDGATATDGESPASPTGDEPDGGGDSATSDGTSTTGEGANGNEPAPIGTTPPAPMNATAGGDWLTNGITLVLDGAQHHVDVAGDAHTTLDGLTVELRVIGLTQTDGLLHAASDKAEHAARQAGGGGNHPADDLLRRIVAGNAYTDEVAPVLWDALADAQPYATREGAGPMTVEPGWYLASLAGMGDRGRAQLAYAGASNRSTSMMMLSGQVKLAGMPSDEPPRPPDSDPANGDDSLLERAMSGLSTLLGGQPQAPAAQPKPNTLDYGAADGSVGRNAYNYDFTWNTEQNGSPAAFCVNPGVAQPVRGATYSRKDIINDNRIRTVLWYGYRGFASIYDQNNEGTWGQHAGGTPQKQAWATHMLVSAYWMGRNPRTPNWSGPYGSGTWSITNDEIMALPGYQQLLWLVENRPLSPNIDFYAWRLYVAIGTKLGEDGLSGTVNTQWDQENKAQAMVSGVFKPTRIDVTTQIRDLSTLNHDRTRPLGDDITITPRKTKADASTSGWPAGEQLLVCSRLFFNNNAGGGDKGPKEKCTVVTPGKDIPQDTPYKLTGQNATDLTFRPSDFPEATVGGKGTAWAAGHLWFDVYFDSRHIPGKAAYGNGNKFYSHVFDFAWNGGNWTYAGIQNGKEVPGENVTLLDFATRKGGGGVTQDGRTAAAWDTVTVKTGGATPAGQWARTWLYVDTNGGNTANMVCGADDKANGFGSRWELRFSGNQATSPQFTPGQCRMMDGQPPLVDDSGRYSGTGSTRRPLTEWAPGHYWYDTKIALADHYGGEYWHHGLRTGDDSESWTRRRLLRTTWTPTATKAFDMGRSKTPVTEFRATLYDADASGKPTSRRQTVAFGPDSKATFTPIEYREDMLGGQPSKAFVYALREEAFIGHNRGVAFDTRTHVVKVTVRKENADRMTATAAPATAPTFANTYVPAPDTVVPSAIKTFTADELAKANITDFRFELIDGSSPTGKVLETRAVDAATVRKSGNDTTGRVTFTPIVYCSPKDTTSKGCPPRPKTDPVGTHVYTVREVAQQAGGVTYDTKLHHYAVTVTDDGVGHLDATISPQPGDGGVEFVNSYTPAPTDATLEARKLYREADGRELKVHAGQFTFDLRDESGKVIATADTRDDGVVTFRGGADGKTDDMVARLHFTAGDMAGRRTITRRFTITEREGDDPYVTYDTQPRKATVTVTDDGVGHLGATVTYGDEPTSTAPVVTNVHRPAVGLPVTGGFDPISAGVLALTTLLLAILGLRALTTARRDRAAASGPRRQGRHMA